MHTGEISFCDKVAFNIKSEDTKKYILDNIKKKYNISVIHKHHEKFSEKSLSILNNSPHLVCLRSNGNPYFLYLMKLNFIQYCIFIDKKIQQGYYLPRMIITHCFFAEELYEDTIFEGEMIKLNNNNWSFVINDLLVYKGNLLNDVNLPKRISMVYGILNKNYKYDEYDLFKMAVKTFFNYEELDHMLNEYIPQLPYSCRGIYFKPLFIRFKDILYNFDDGLIKKVERKKFKEIKQFILNEKEVMTTSSSSSSTSIGSNGNNAVVCQDKDNTNHASDITKKFMVKKTASPDIYELYENNKMVGICCIPTMKLSKKMRELTKDMNMVDKIEIEHIYSKKFEKWMPLLEC